MTRLSWRYCAENFFAIGSLINLNFIDFKMVFENEEMTCSSYEITVFEL